MCAHGETVLAVPLSNSREPPSTVSPFEDAAGLRETRARAHADRRRTDPFGTLHAPRYGARLGLAARPRRDCGGVRSTASAATQRLDLGARPATGEREVLSLSGDSGERFCYERMVVD